MQVTTRANSIQKFAGGLQDDVINGFSPVDADAELAGSKSDTLWKRLAAS